MEKPADAFDSVKAQAEQYVDDRITLIKLQVVEKSSRLFAKLFTGFVMIVVAFCIVVFLSIMAGDWFAALLGSQFKGFAIIAGVYILLLLFILTRGRRLVGRFLTNKIIQLFFDKTSHPNNYPNEKND